MSLSQVTETSTDHKLYHALRKKMMYIAK